MARVKVIGARTDSEHAEALRLAKRYESLTNDVLGYRVGYHPARTRSDASYVVRKFPDRIEVLVLGQPEDDVETIDVDYSYLRRPVHGFVVSTRIRNGAKRLPVKVRDPLRGYQIRDSWQITHPIFRQYPRGFQSFQNTSKWAGLYSHLVKVRPTMYTGHMREVVQLGNAIGFGAEEEDRRHDFYKPLYRLTSDITDGIVFVPYYSDKPIGSKRYGLSFEVMRPVVIRIDQARGKVYAAPLTYWDEAWADDPVLSSPDLRYLDRWVKWASVLKKVKPDPAKGRYPDPFSERIVSIYGGWPSSEPLFETKINCVTKTGKSDVAETLRQRVSAGLIAETSIEEVTRYGHAIGPGMGWAFSYMTPAAYSVLHDYSNQHGVPYARLVTLVFDVAINDQTAPTPGGGSLVEFVDYWVGKGVLDGLASERKLSYLSGTDLRQFARDVRDLLASGRAYADMEHLAKRFAKAEVPGSAKVLSLSTNISVGYSGYVDNPVRFPRKGPRPDIEVKYPEYDLKDGAGDISWIPTVEPGSRPPRKEVAPISVFESRENGVVVTFIASAETDEESPEVNNPDVPCWVDSKDTQTRTYKNSARHFGTNLDNGHFSDRTYTHTTKMSRRCAFLAEVVGASDWLMDLDTGTATKTKRFLCTYTTEQYQDVALFTHGIFPLLEREGVYIGYLPHGKGAGVRSVSYQNASVSYYWVALYGRCFGGYLTPPIGYHDCGDTKYVGGHCPAYAWDPEPAGGFPRRVTDPKYAFLPSPCLHHVGNYAPWAHKCLDIDALSEKNVSVPDAPPGKIETTDPFLTTFVRYTGSSVSAITLYREGKDPHISGWWPIVSPDPDTNLVAFIYAYENCSGAPAAIVWRDITHGEEPFRSGAAKRFPLSSMNYILAVGVPIDD